MVINMTLDKKVNTLMKRTFRYIEKWKSAPDEYKRQMIDLSYGVNVYMRCPKQYRRILLDAYRKHCHNEHYVGVEQE